MVRRTVEDSDTGLQVLYKASNPRVDIVAVHGIGAHREETWSAAVKQEGGEMKWMNWLSDPTMLPKELPDSRVLNWGYKSDWFGNPVQHSLSSLGDLLWTSLNIERENCQDRPIIFVAHCFGGLIVMRVLIERSQATIARATAGIAFLGTPFRGTDERFHQELPKMAEANIGSVDDRILHYLVKGNPTLKDLLDAFLEMRSGSDMPRVMCFYECLETQVNKIVNDPKPLKFVVVDNDSATLDKGKGIDKHAFQRNHFQLNKFKSPKDDDFKFLCKTLKGFRSLADEDVRPGLRTVVASQQHELSHAHIFQWESWVERPLTLFNTNGMKSETVQIRYPKKFSPLTSGISLDCCYMFLRNKHSIHVYLVADIQLCDAKKSTLSPVLTYQSSGKKIVGVSIGRTVCASITNETCSLHRFIDKPKSQVMRNMSQENNWRLSCVAVLETTRKDDLIIVALGLQQIVEGVEHGRVEVHSIWQNDWREHTRILVADLWDHTTRMNDSPKTLSFSLDGGLLTCTTVRHNQIHSWQLPTAEAAGKIKKVCETSRPFNIGVNAKGITSTTNWMSFDQHPYVLCTTSPCAERHTDGGEWTFIAPLSMPFVSGTEKAYHCLLQVQHPNSKHLHIHAGAISPQGNLVALLDSNGRVCLIPLYSGIRGGIVSQGGVTSPPIKVKPKLGRNENGMADIRFDLSGTKLYATNWNGKVLIISLPEASPAEIKVEPRRAPTFEGQSQSERRQAENTTSEKSSSQQDMGQPIYVEPKSGKFLNFKWPFRP